VRESCACRELRRVITIDDVEIVDIPPCRAQDHDPGAISTTLDSHQCSIAY